MSQAEFTAFLIDAMTRLDSALVDGGLAYVCMDWRNMQEVLTAADAAGLTVAEKTGRRCRMTELYPKYADVTIRRWQAVSRREAVHEGLGLTFRTLSFSRPEPEARAPVRVRVRQPV